MLALLSIFILLSAINIYTHIKGKIQTETKTIDLKNDDETPLNINGFIMHNNNSTLYVIKGLSYESKDDDPIGKILITEYEVKLLVNNKMIGTYTNTLEPSKEFASAIDDITFSLDVPNTFDMKSKIKVQIKYTTIENDKNIVETDLFI